jgi:predicted glycosyltransferase
MGLYRGWYSLPLPCMAIGEDQLMRVWVDCTAAAHPLVLRPLIERLEGRGHEVFVTTREYGQTVGVLERLGIPFTVVGEHGGGSSLGKAAALAGRSARLAGIVWRRRPELAIAHGSVDLAVVCALLRVPSVQLQDYELAGWQRKISFRVARRVLVPDAIPLERLERIGASREKLVRFPGLKEEYYLADFEPDPAVLDELGLDREKVLVVVRPPPETSEYHAPNDLYWDVIQRLAGAHEAQAVVIPRTKRQAAELQRFNFANLRIPGHAIDAQSLIAYADLAVSAGGTMNREAVALGTPVFTTFAGGMGGVDKQLIAEGRLRVLENVDELPLRKRKTPVGVVQRRDPELLVKGVLEAAKVAKGPSR